MVAPCGAENIVGPRFLQLAYQSNLQRKQVRTIKSAVQNTTQRCIACRIRAQPAENFYGLEELTVRPPLLPGAVDGQRSTGVLDIDEEHLAVGREGRAGEFGIVHAVVPEAVDLA